MLLAVAAPVVARQLRRDKEIESQHRMQQYVRAVQMYQRKFPGQYPASVKVLESTNNMRFLRQVYVDPLTGKADYKLIHLGEQKTKIHVFFGQELGGLAANLGTAAGMQSAGGVGPSVGAGATNATNVTSTNALNSGFGGATIGGSPGTAGAAGTSGTAGTGSSSSSDSSVGSLGVIVGVGTSRSGTSITEPNQQTTYETWEFWYDPRIELLKQGVNVTGGGMVGGSTGSAMGSQSASSFGQSGTTGQPNSGAANGLGNLPGTLGGASTGTPNPNSSTPNPF